MSDPSPDTPSVVAVRVELVEDEVWLVDADGNEVGVMARSTFDRCVATPAAPGSSSPDVAALAERLRDDGLQARHHDEVLTADDACRWGGVGALLWAEGMFKAADALEAQAARNTELERWKAEALVVLGQWDEVWEALGRPGPLGSSKAVEALTEAHRLRATDPPADVHPRHPRQETPE